MAIASGSYTIGGSSPNYATIQLWEDDFATTLTGVVEGKCREATFNEAVTIGGVTSSASAYPVLTFDTGAFHDGDFRAGVQMRGPSENTGDSHCILVQQQYTRIIGLNFNRWHGTSAEAIRVDERDVRIERCLFWGAGNINADGIFIGNGTRFQSTHTTDTLYVSNCIFAGLGRTAIHVQGDKSGVVYVYKCTGVYLNMGNQNTTDGDVRSYVGFGDDLGAPPTTNGVSWNIKSTYSHCWPDPNGIASPAFAKASASSWGASTKNASADSTAPGTSPQTSASVASQFTEIGVEYRVGENTADDHDPGAFYDARINSGAPTTNYGSADLGLDNSPVINTLFRIPLSGVSNTHRVLVPTINAKRSSTSGSNQTFGWYRLLRAWVEAQVTYNVYSTGNSWATAGATGTGDIEANCADGGTTVKRSSAFETSSVTSGGQIAINEWFRWSAGKFVDWVQDAIDGNAPGANANDFEVITRWFAQAYLHDFYSTEDADGSRPFLEYWYDTSTAPLDFKPDTGGVLDGNGDDLSSDGSYPVTIDIFGRDATADIGAVSAGVDHLGAASLTASATLAAKPTRELPSVPVQLWAGTGYKSLNESFDVEDPIATSGLNGRWWRGADYGTYHTVARGGYYIWPNGLWHGDVQYDSEYPKQIDQWPSGVATVTANDTTAPDGTLTADKVEDDSASVRETKGATAINVPNGAWVLHTGALKKQVGVTNNVYFEHGSYDGAFPGICIDPVTGAYAHSAHEWVTVVDHPMDPDNWWFFAGMYINDSGADRSITTWVSPALNDNDPVDQAAEVAATGICHVWNVGITVIDAQADRPWGGARAGIRINVVDDTSTAGGEMHHYGVWLTTGQTYDGPIWVRAKVRGAAVPIGLRIVREIDSTYAYNTTGQDVLSTITGNGQWQDVEVMLQPRASGTATTNVMIRAGIHDDGTPVNGNFVEIDEVKIHYGFPSVAERSAAASITGVAEIGSDPVKSRGGLGTDLSQWEDSYSRWTVNAGAYRCTANVADDANLRWNHVIPIDRTITKVKFGFSGRLVSGTSPRLFLGLQEFTSNANYDYGGNPSAYISPRQVNIFTDTETTLAADLLNGHTTASLTSGANWEDSTSAFYLQYNIENDQSDLPNNNTIGMDGITGNTVSLSSAWGGSTIPAGTKVRQSRSGGTHQYAHFPIGTLTGSFVNVETEITQPFESIDGGFSGSYSVDGDNAIFADAVPAGVWAVGGFRPTTEFLGLRVFVLNHDSTTVVEVDDLYIRTYAGDSIFSEVTHSAASALSAPITLAVVPRAERAASVAITGVIALDILGGEPVIWLRPDGDLVVTNFEDEGGGTTDIYQSIDEVTRSDADYIRSSGGSGTYECSLTTVGQPTPDTYHAIAYAFRRGPDVLGTDLDMEFQVRQGSTVIASWTEVAVDNQSWVEKERYLTTQQVANITDYGDLRLRVIVQPTQQLLTYFPGDPKGTFTRTGDAYEWVP